MNEVESTDLAPREIVVLQAIADGESTVKVAELIGFRSAEATKNLLRKVYIKLGADNRAHAVAICFRRKLIT